MTSRRNIAALIADDDGQASVEWVLVVLAVVLPMMFFLNKLLGALVEFYGMVTTFITMPFP